MLESHYFYAFWHKVAESDVKISKNKMADMGFWVKESISGVEISKNKMVVKFSIYILSDKIVTIWVCLAGCCNNNPQPRVCKKMYPGTEFNLRNSEKGHLVVSQTFDLNFLPFQGHKNHFSTYHF